jgi:ABC-type thiamine transport system ATPase subunit
MFETFGKVWDSALRILTVIDLLTESAEHTTRTILVVTKMVEHEADSMYQESMELSAGRAVERRKKLGLPPKEESIPVMTTL